MAVPEGVLKSGEGVSRVGVQLGFFISDTLRVCLIYACNVLITPVLIDGVQATPIPLRGVNNGPRRVRWI